MNTNLWFPLTDSEGDEAKAVCADCPVRVDCLEWAIATNQEDGIWGGVGENARRRIRRRRREGRSVA